MGARKCVFFAGNDKKASPRFAARAAFCRYGLKSNFYRQKTPSGRPFTGNAVLQALEHTAQKHGPAKALSNFIIGLEDLDTLSVGAQHLAKRGILPAASVWMPMGRPVLGSMKAPNADYYKRTVKRRVTTRVKTAPYHYPSISH